MSYVLDKAATTALREQLPTLQYSRISYKEGRFWEWIKEQPIGERQQKVLNRMIDGFDGNLTSS